MPDPFPYVYARIEEGPRAAQLGQIHNIEDSFELLKGVPRAATWPDDAYFPMSENAPDNLVLEDALFNITDVLVVSERVREALEGEDLPHNEWLPVRIRNHKGRMEAAPYYVLHQTHHQDAIDLERSEYKRNAINPARLTRVKKLVVDPARVDPEARVFRLAGSPKPPLFERALAERLAGAGLKGLAFGEVEDYRSTFM